MNDSEFHLESLRERARTGTLTQNERLKVAQHEAVCAACALESRLEQAAAPQDRDSDLLARAMSGALASLEQQSPAQRASAPAEVRAVRLSGLKVAVMAAILGSVTAAAAGGTWWVITIRPAEIERAEQPRDQSSAPPAALERPRATAAQPKELVVAEEATPPPLPTPRAGQIRDAQSPAELLSQASHFRVSDPAKAASLYLELQQRYPKSPEAHVSRVSLGRLYLNRLGAPAAALAEFEASLRGSADGTLAQEALAGRALALQRLGRVAEERKAWEQLLRRFPDSVQADRAKARLEVLASPAEQPKP
jgi:TolA-binding protein